MTAVKTMLLAGLASSALIASAAHARDAAPSDADVKGTEIAAEAEPTGAADDQSRRAVADANETITVTARKSEPVSNLAAKVIEFGNAVQIVGAPEIAASGAINFAEAVQFLVKGANIGYSPDEGEYTIRLDGGGDRDTLVVLDGVPLYDRGPALEEIWGATTIDPHMIDRIEVFRGGNSLFFGSNGGIGVVSVVTKKPDGDRRFEFGASYGRFNTREIWGNATMPLDADGRHSIMVYGTSLQTDGPRIFNPSDYVDNVAAGGGVQKFPLSRTDIGVKYLWKVDDGTDLRVNAIYTQSEFQDPFPDTNTYSPNRVRYPIVDASLTRRWSPALLTELSGYWSNPKLNNTETFPEVCMIRAGCVSPSTGAAIAWGKYTGRSIAFPNQGYGPDSKNSGFREIGANVRNTLTTKYFEVAGGVQYVSYKNDSDPVFPIGVATTTVTGLYADLRPSLPFSPDTKISIAGRIDFSKSFGHKTIWKFGVRQPIGDFYVRANGGTSYSLPKNNERFAQSLTLVGNPDLKTEQTKTFNGAAGYAASWSGGRVSLEAGAFRTNITNRIQSTSGLTPNTYFNNSAVTLIRGLTADVDLNIGDQWTASLGYTRQRAHLRGSSLQINETPLWFVSGIVGWQSKDEMFHLSLLPRYQGPEYATGGVANALRKNFGEYFLMNASVGLWLGEKHQHRFQLRVVNIFDKKYAERWAFGNQRFSQAFVTGQIVTNGAGYFYGYPFEGKPRSVYVSYTTSF
jgi:iron complex outermembrane receptor protein